MKFFWLLIIAVFTCVSSGAFTRQDSLRGSNGPGRDWWDVQRYDLVIEFDFEKKSISGRNEITFKVTDTPNDSLQLDLQELMFLDKVEMDGRTLTYFKDGNVFWIKMPVNELQTGLTKTLTATYHGKPRTAVKPPWDGGFIWTKDGNGKPWVAVACQGLGASSWWPCKDYQGDEPDSGMHVHLNAPSKMVVSNGISLSDTIEATDPVTGQSRFFLDSYSKSWTIKNPINSYDVTFYIGDYVHWSDTVMGEKGKLNLDFYALRENEQKAHKQFQQAKTMLHCFEYWMGPYPFYEDGYKLVEAPYLGMEHQSAVAYGNHYKNGYLGIDRSGTGVGLAFDYIIVHESGHEWFGNNITAKDVADNWIHEGFTTYTETLFAECILGKSKARDYNLGEWENIDNDKPIIGAYGVNDDGSGDKYDKGAAMLHMIRTVMDNDEQFRQMLRGLNQTFYHQTVTTQQVEDYISKFSKIDFSPLFNQYLRTTNIPKLEWYRKDKRLYFRFADVEKGFTLPIQVGGSKKEITIHPTETWDSITWKGSGINFQKDFLIKIGSVSPPDSQ